MVFFVLHFLPYLSRVTLEKKKSVCIGGRELYKKISLRVGEIAPWLRMGCSCRGPELHSQRPCWTAHNHLHATAAPRHLMPPRKKRLHEIHTDPPTRCLPQQYLLSLSTIPGLTPTPSRTAFWSYFHPRPSSQVFGRDFWS